MELAGYAVSPLREGDVTLYRGSGKEPATALLVAVANALPGSWKRLEHEYALRSELDLAWAARPVELRGRNGEMTLVLEDPGGEPLDRLLCETLTLSHILPVAISLARALARMHERGLVHKDIKPANVLADLSSGRAWLTGFGLASRIARERATPAPPEVISGSLAYMAPEQTGRMNRSIDARSDLYSFGVTLYELLTGELPFTASDAMEWVHCHIARQPIPPSDRGVPVQLSAIVMKLLAKTAEDRYQTAAGIEADLRRCLVQWEAHGRIEAFALGTHDASDRLVIPERLYGREREIAALLVAFDRVVADGRPELVLVSGYSGVGKSSVVNELHKVLVPPRGLFASGKFDQYKRDVPYATLAQAFESLVRQILVKSDIEVDAWRHALAEAVGPNGQLIVNIVPELELIIGKQPPVPDLPPQDAQTRFQTVFRKFLGVFARPEHPLVLFLDDLQWLDTATLEMLERLVSDPDMRYLMVVGAYRDNEVSATHPFMRTLRTIRETAAALHEIVLAPLGFDDVVRLVSDATRSDAPRAKSLAELVYEKTGGNPFFAIQFLTALADEELLVFDPDAGAWRWDVARIRAKGYTDNVVDLVVRKLRRLREVTQDELRQLACIGNAVDIETLAVAQGRAQGDVDAGLWEAVQAGIVSRLDGAYTFLHDRIQQAAYSLIPEEQRADAHLRIARALLANTTPDQLADRPFDIANQFNRGAGRLVDRAEKVRVATIDLRSGCKAKASAAYDAARSYFSAGMALLDGTDWAAQRPLMFRLRIERAECELLCGDFETAGQLIEDLLQHAASNVEFAEASGLKVYLHVLRGEQPQAVESALTCLARFGIDLPEHPSFQQVQAEYKTVSQMLDQRPAEDLIELPMMIDPEMPAAMQMLSILGPPAYFTDFHLFCVIACRMVQISMQYGMSDASALAYALLGFISGPVFHRYRDGYRFAKLACDLVEKHGFTANRPKVNHAMGTVAFWTQPVGTAIEFMRTAFRTATETGDLTFACYGLHQLIAGLLMRNDSLETVWRESEVALDFARTAKYEDEADIFRSQQRFIAAMQGRTTTFSTFSEVGEFDEAAFEAGFSCDRMPLMVCFYWILKLRARFLSGDYADALAAANNAKPLLSIATAQIQLCDYFYYTALAVAALYEHASVDRQHQWRELLRAHVEQLREWADVYPPTFVDKHALVSAEIARLEGRDLDAMQLYELAIQSARHNGFVQNEGLAREVAARFYTARGFETIARPYLRHARTCFLQWGAHGKVSQLDRLCPQLGAEHAVASTQIDMSVEQLAVGTVVKASQAVSSEIEPGRLIEALMRLAVQHAGAERGVLILFEGDEARIAAEASTGIGVLDVTLRYAAVTSAEVPESVLNYAIRTRQSVLQDDAATSRLFSEDPYVRERRPKSLFCLPLLKQTKIVGALYLENWLTSRAFRTRDTALLELIASQAAISLENANLYSNLRRSESFLAEGQRLSRTGTFIWDTATEAIVWSDECYRIFEHDRSLAVTPAMLMQRIHPEDRDTLARTLGRARSNGQDFDLEHRLLMPDGAVKYLHVVTHAVNDPSDPPEFIGAVMDITATKRAEDDLLRARAELAHVARVTTLGELAASISHEINQPLAAVVTNAEACRRWLDRAVPNLGEVREALDSVVSAGHRAAAVTRKVRAFLNKSDAHKMPLDINDVVAEALVLLQHEVFTHRVSMRTRLADGLSVVNGDRIQLQQVIINFVINGIEAMHTVDDRARELVIQTEQDDTRHVRVSVRDSGAGIAPAHADQLFKAFFTTKSSGMGMGLSICRSIIDAHGGYIFGFNNSGPGATFAFTLPPHSHDASSLV